MKLRKLEMRDAPLMAEWLQDPDIYSKMQYNYHNASVDSARNFIESSYNDNKCIHLAIVSENDEYLGTVSLKNIDKRNKNAEFAIVIRKCAMGRGISLMAFRQILEIAFQKIKLNKLYLYVRTDNIRAIKFYEKCHLNLEGCFREHLFVEGKFYDLKYYSILQSDYHEWIKWFEEKRNEIHLS